MATPPVFIEQNVDKVRSEIYAQIEQLTGKPLQPGQPEATLVDAQIYREMLLRAGVQYAAQSNLVAFAPTNVLEYLAENIGVERIPAQPAKCTLRFTVPEGYQNIFVAEGTRITTSSGTIIFETVADIESNGTPGDTDPRYVDIQAVCTEDGIRGNGYPVGKLDTLLDEVESFDGTISNTDVTASGSDPETDDQLRARIPLAMNGFSVAGPREAYRFWAFTASPLIIDVAVLDPYVPGTVRVYPLVAGGSTPPQVITAVEAVLSAEIIRPLCAYVDVQAPTVQNYTLTYNLVRKLNYDTSDVQTRLEAALTAYTAALAKKLSKDVINSQAVAAASVDGVFDVTISFDAGSGPVSSIAISESEVAICTNIIAGTITIADE